MMPPPKSRVKKPGLAAEQTSAKMEPPGEKVAEEQLADPFVPTITAIVNEPPAPEITFTSPVVVSAAPLAPRKNDPTTTDTVEVPPKKFISAEKAVAPTPKSKPLFVIEDEPQAPPISATILASVPVGPTTARFEVAPPIVAAPTVPEPLPIAPQVATPPAATLPAVKSTVEPQPAIKTSATPARPKKSQRPMVWPLAVALLAATFISIAPAVWELSDYFRSAGAFTVSSWVFLLLMLGMVQFATVVLLAQVPDWASVWMVTLQSLAFAAIYAALLGLTIMTSGETSLVSTLQLDQQYATGKAQPWCIFLAAVYACLAFFAGRMSAQWRKRHAIQHAAAHA
ncbi:hypothetical protein [Anatilimnocola floriformis]|uniref:hypothetical protein n=1 Tax=Anatilimnocola floriformis TaxID=2948575 RepID=UPI0020C2C76F|nr:hypothetical protein [Anatilimnocola floriformis]